MRFIGDKNEKDFKSLHMTAVKRPLEGISFPRVVFGESLFGNVNVNFEQKWSGHPFPNGKRKLLN